MRLFYNLLFATLLTPTLLAAAGNTITPVPESTYTLQVNSDLAVGTAAVERLLNADEPAPLTATTQAAASTSITFTFDSPPTIPTSIYQTDIAKQRAMKKLENIADSMISLTPVSASIYDTGVLRVMIPTSHIQPFAAIALTQDQKTVDENRLGFGAGTRVNFSKYTNLGTELLVFPNDGFSGFDALGKLGDVRMITRLEIKF